VVFTTPLASPTCTAFASVKVTIRKGKATKETIAGCAEQDRCADRDKLKLVCEPPA
jgi:hypothetical protein